MLTYLAIFMGGLSLFCLSGLGPFIWLCREVPNRVAAFLGFTAALGLGTYAIVAVWCFYLERPAITVTYGALTVSFGLTIAAWFLKRASLTSLLDRVRRLVPDGDILSGLFVAVMIVFSAGYQGGLGQPFRLGIDQVGYAMTAQYLADGGTASAIEREVVLQTQQLSREHALNAHITTVSLSVNVVSEYLLMAQRFVYPLVVAAICKTLGYSIVADYQFLLLAVPLFISTLLIYWMCYEIVGLPNLVAKLIAVAFALNCNNINLAFEGQHAQIAVTPYLVLFFALLLQWRSSFSDTALISRAQLPFGLVTLCGCAIFVLYSEAYFALGAFCLILLIWDLCVGDKTIALASIGFGLLIFLGCLVSGLYFYNWVGFIFKQLATVSGGAGGFWQPQWAFPVEIVGVKSIYAGVEPFWVRIPNLYPRVAATYPWLIGYSGLMFILFFASRFWRSSREFRFWLTPVVVCLAVLLYAYYVIKTINYSYTKTFLLMLVPLVVAHWASLYHWFVGFLPKSWSVVLFAMCICVPIYVGCVDSMAYADSSKKVPADIRRLRTEERRLNLSDAVVCTESTFGLDLMLYGAYFPFNWLNLGWADKKLAPSLDKNVVILVQRAGCPDFDRITRDADAVFVGMEIALFRTGKKLREMHLPEFELVASKSTVAMTWTQNQAPKVALFVSNYLRDLRARSLAEKRLGSSRRAVP